MQIDTPSARGNAARPPFGAARVILALMLREMSAMGGRKPGGFIWQVLEPVGGIVLLALVFSAGFRHPALGTSFAIYYATGIMPFALFQTVSGRLSLSLRQSRHVLGFARVTVVDVVLARFLLLTLTQLLVSCLVLGGILLFVETGTILDLPTVVLGYAMAVALALGIGSMSAFLTARIPLWRPLWLIVTRPLVIVSGVIFLHDEMPEPWRTWLEWNPLVHVTGMVRRGFYFGYEAAYVDVTYVFAVAGACLALGLLFLTAWGRDLAD